MEGFLNLNKPFGLTSHDCVGKARRLFSQKKIGHGGTLDPMATGVLPIALGKATRLLQYLREDKAYKATIRFGVTTTTDDLEGEIIATQSVEKLTLEQVKSVLPKFQGKIEQVPPIYSAIQVEGKRLYDIARAGKTVDVPSRIVEIYQIEILDWRAGDVAELDVLIACGSGTYIRAIARDLGVALETGGTLAALTRTESCGFPITNSLTFEELETQLNAGTFQPILPECALQHLPVISLPATTARRWCQGQKISDLTFSSLDETDIQSKIFLRVIDEQNRFLGIGNLLISPEGKLLIPQMVFEPI